MRIEPKLEEETKSKIVDYALLYSNSGYVTSEEPWDETNEWGIYLIYGNMSCLK